MSDTQALPASGYHRRREPHVFRFPGTHGNGITEMSLQPHLVVVTVYVHTDAHALDPSREETRNYNFPRAGPGPCALASRSPAGPAQLALVSPPSRGSGGTWDDPGPLVPNPWADKASGRPYKKPWPRTRARVAVPCLPRPWPLPVCVCFLIFINLFKI